MLQYKWLRLLAGPHTAVFAVGDDDQSIYAFRGANVANMQHFERDFATAERPVKLIKLEQNYRSHGHILDAANALIQHNQARLGKNLWTSEGKGEPVRVFAAPTRPRRGGVHRRRRRAASPATASRSTRSRCSTAATRSRACSSTRCSARRIPYRVYGGMRFFERAEVKHALAYLRLIAAPDDDGAFLRVVNFPPRGIGARSLEQLQDARAAAAARRLWQAAASGRRRRQVGQRRSRRSCRLIETLRAETRALPLPEAVEHVIEAVGARGALPAARRTARTRSRTCRSSSTRPTASCAKRELATDAPMLSERVAPTPPRRTSGPRRRRDRSVDRVPRARRARGRRHAGGRGPARAAAHDRALGEGPRVPHGVRHRARGGPVPAREQPATRSTASRRSGGSCTSRSRARAGGCT